MLFCLLYIIRAFFWRRYHYVNNIMMGRETNENNCFRALCCCCFGQKYETTATDENQLAVPQTDSQELTENSPESSRRNPVSAVTQPKNIATVNTPCTTEYQSTATYPCSPVSGIESTKEISSAGRCTDMWKKCICHCRIKLSTFQKLYVLYVFLYFELADITVFVKTESSKINMLWCVWTNKVNVTKCLVLN